jgi:H+/Cl- antiporter ClcA
MGSTDSNAGVGAVGAALGVILVYVIEVFTGTDIPIAVEGAITVVVTFLVGYLVPARIGGGTNGGNPEGSTR